MAYPWIEEGACAWGDGGLGAGGRHTQARRLPHTRARYTDHQTHDLECEVPTTIGQAIGEGEQRWGKQDGRSKTNWPLIFFHQAMSPSLPFAVGLTLVRNGGRGVVMAGADGPGVPEKGRGEGEGGTKDGRGGLEVRASSSPLVSLSSLLLSPSEWARARPRPPRDGGA